MKTLKQLREEYDTLFLSDVSDEIMLEGTVGQKGKYFDTPSVNRMPSLLMFRRVTYRKYPNDQTVALYYSKSVDKYLSIPFGPTGNLNLGEATIYDTLDDLDLHEGAKWEAVKGGIKGAAHGAVKGAFVGNAIAATPGIAAGAAIGATRGAYKGAKNAYKKAKEIDEDWQSVNRKDKTDGLSQAAVNAYRRENPGSKLKTAVTEKNPTGKRAARRKSFCSRMGGMKKRLTSAKTARDPDSRINKALRRWNCEESFKQKLNEKREERLDENPLALGALRLAGGALSSIATKGIKSLVKTGLKKIGGKVLDAATGGSGDEKKAPAQQTAAPENDSLMPNSGIKKVQSKSYSAFKRGGETATDTARRNTLMRKEYDAATKKQQQVAENKIVDLRKMINENVDKKDIQINGRTVTLNTSMAKRILEVYDSVNTKNKKIVEGMLNEDLESFKKLLNFSIRK